MRRSIITVAWGMAALLVAAPARAQDPLSAFIGRPVASVRIDIENVPASSPALLELVSVKPGAPLRIEDWRTTMARLYGTGRFENIQVLATDTPDGVAVVFNAIPKHPVDQVAFEGDLVLPRADLERFVKERFGARLSTIRSGLVADAVKGLLVDEGYLNAQVSSTAEPDHVNERATLHVKIDAGIRAVIGEREVHVKPPLTVEQVLSKMSAQAGQPFRERALRSSLRAIRDELRANGYYEAIVPFVTRASADGTKVDLTITVDPGPRVDVRWQGDPRPDGDPDDLVPLKRQASADDDLLDDADVNIRKALWHEGYWKAQVQHTKTKDEADNTLVIVFTITRGRRYRIDRIDVAGNEHQPRAALEDLIKLKNAAVFRQSEVDAGVARVRAGYLVRGFYDVKIESVVNELASQPPGDALVAVVINITEGPEARVAAIEFQGVARLAQADLQRSMRLRVGGPYIAIDVLLDEETLRAQYHNAGFVDAGVQLAPKFSGDRRSVTLLATVTEGPQITVAAITVIGNRRVSRELILEKLKLKVGQPLGLATIEESQGLLYELSGFRRVKIDIEPRLAGETTVRVVVSVEESPAVTYGFGGGLVGGNRPRAIDTEGGVENRLEFAPRGSFEISRRNLGGRNQSLNFFSRVSLRPQDAPRDPERDGKGVGFSEYRVTTTFQARGAFRSPTDLVIGFTSEQALRTTFNFLRQSASAELLRPLSPRVSLSGRYSLDFTELFDERFTEDQRPLIDQRFPQVRLSIFSTGVSWDRKNNPLTPTHGTYVTGDVEVAGRAVGSEVGYAKTFLTGAVYRSLTTSDKIVFAGRAQAGVARGFERPVTTIGPDGEPREDTVADLPASQRFFAGGGTSVRGFDVDRLGVPEILDPRSGLSNGGNGLIVLNLELRTTPGRLKGRLFSLVGFVDSGNVFAKAGDMDLGKLRSALGFGFRYDSPLGPLRLDFGFKTDRRIVGGSRERGWAWHLSLGEAF